MGYGTGANDALQEMLTRARAEGLQREQQQMQQQAAQRAQQALDLQAKGQAADEADRVGQRKLQTAQIAIGQARPGQELTPDVVSQIQGTPYAGRLQTQDTLPATGIGMPAGVKSFTTLTPTVEQEQAQGQQTAKRRVVDLIQRSAPRNDILSAMADSGENIGVAALNDPADARKQQIELANLQHTNRLGEIGAEGAQQRLTNADKPGATSPKLSTTQQDDIATMDTVAALGNQALALGTQTQWSGVGGMKQGSIAQFTAKNFGKGTPDETKLRGIIGNIQGTVARLRGGTSFTPNEQALLETYTPTIDEDPETVIIPKIQQLQAFIAEKKKNTLRVASGDMRGPQMETSRGPQIGETRTINGQAAHWDGHGWLAGAP